MVDRYLLPQQTEFLPETGLPRWGCYFLSLGAWLQLQENVLLSFDEYLDVYHRCRNTVLPCWGHPLGKNEAPVLEMMDGSTYELRCNRPSVALQAWADAVSKGKWKAYLTRTERGWVGGTKKESFRLWRWVTVNGNGHYVLSDVAGETLYNPLEAVALREKSDKFVGFYLEI